MLHIKGELLAVLKPAFNTRRGENTKKLIIPKTQKVGEILSTHQEDVQKPELLQIFGINFSPPSRTSDTSTLCKALVKTKQNNRKL